MRHAILILAHKNVEQICRLAEYFCHDCDVFVHLDKKMTVSADDLKRLNSIPQVVAVEQEFEVNWGGTSVLESEMYLLRVAHERSDAEYFHLISGQDYPVRPLDHFLRFFEGRHGDDKREYISLITKNNENTGHNIFRRLRYFYPYDLAADKPNPRVWVAGQVREQEKRQQKRPLPDEFDHLYGSSQWFSITRHAAKTLLDYTDEHPSFYRRMWMTFAPEECYVATVIVNLLGEDKIAGSNHRFIRWKYENGNSPANLGSEHLAYLVDGDNWFARKIEHPVSQPLLSLIDRYLLRDSEIRPMPTGGWDYDGLLAYAPLNERFCQHVQQLYYDTASTTALDAGCGAGVCVAWWRRNGLPFAGLDANPHTADLSRLLLPKDDEPCVEADLTEELDVPQPFDLVVCKDVLPYIPEQLEPLAIQNLAHLARHIIVLRWATPTAPSQPTSRTITQQHLQQAFDAQGFNLERFLTARMQVALADKQCAVFIRKGTEILEDKNR